ncbi:hypothetical protein V496_08538 [Pseudogymnoascus sp. VKM F-4515 (FW-2607)]|nr:hypothetical protein V496_08538 [Pseudogymnoascus sp. VKM F-4515 (FW-2607)]
MALSRAFTTRKGSKASNTAPIAPTRSLTTKHSFPAGTIRNKISGPMELLSTTNMLSYNAPDLHPTSTSPVSSGDESDIPSMSHSTTTTPDSSVRGSGSSNTTPISPSPNHLSSYFANADNKAPTTSTAATDAAPSIPQRAMSHTKKSHEILSRQRSTRQQPSHTSTHSTASTSTSSRKPSISHPRSSIDFFSPSTAPAFDTTANPFTNELAQVRELAEEYSGGAARREVSEEEEDLYARGLFKFSAAEYVAEIEPLYCEMVGRRVKKEPAAMMWI